MKKILLLGFFFSLCCLMMQCGSPTRAALQQESVGFFQQSLEVAGDLSLKIDEMRQMRNNINIQGRFLNRQELDFVVVVDSLDTAFQNWQETFIPFPRYSPEGRPLPGQVSGKRSKAWLHSAARLQKEQHRELLGILERLNAVLSGW